MSKRVSDCGTTHLIEYEIKSKKHLEKLNGKFYKPALEEGEEDSPLIDYKLVNAKKDKHLIGKKIRVRSAVTCCLGDHVCPKCVGLTSINNMDIADGMSAFESEEITKVVNQSILSTKHLLTTNSESIIFNSEFYKFFSITSGEINPIVNDNEEVYNYYHYNIEDYAIYIDPEDIVMMEEQDYNALYNTIIQNGRFYIRNIKNKEEKDILIQVEGDKEIFLSEDAIEAMKKGKGLIYFKDINDDIKLFEMDILNQELTKPLYELINLLDKKRSSADDNIDASLESISQKMLDIMIESGIDANVIAAELIINRLVRSKANDYERPDFTKEELEPYEIFTVGKALEHNKSPLIGLSFQYIKRQILSDELYSERNSSSFVDPLYYTQIPTDNLKIYDRLARSNDGEF